MESATELLPGIESIGLDLWMNSVVIECDRVRRDFAAEPVHDLRVALRHCRSIADGFIAFDPHPAWKQMKNESKMLFRQLGALRDVQVMLEWLQRLPPAEETARASLTEYLLVREGELKENAATAVNDFNRKKWTAWNRLLGTRVRNVQLESMAFQHLALERWIEARHLHDQALRNRSQIAYHNLRIALKKFRYTVENFLPSQQELWGADLKELQDCLGDMHDLDVLWRTANSIQAIPDQKIRAEWHSGILCERELRLQSYRKKTLGRTSLWNAWRSRLPGPDRIKEAALARLQAWALFRDSDPPHSEHVARLALQIYDGLDALDLIPKPPLPEGRFLLQAAALAHGVGAYELRRKRQLAAYRMIRRLNPSLGWSFESLRLVALIARFHRGALPHTGKRVLYGLSEAQIKSVAFLSGILRLANAFDHLNRRRVRRLEMSRSENSIIVSAPGYVEHDKSAEKLAAARHLLEIACRAPIRITGQEN